MKKLINFCLLIFGVFQATGQMIIPPSPGVAGLANYGGQAVNLHYGIPQIVVPLVALPHPNGSSIPVVLSYNAAGHKVQDPAGNIGLGWTLQAGGAVFRIVRGRPDVENGFITPTNNATRYDIALNLKDGERDLFMFSMQGIAGSFVISNDGTIFYQEVEQNIKIEKIGTLATSCTWVLTDGFGVKYYFGESNASRETSEFKDPFFVNKVNVTSAWYLSKIVYPDSPVKTIFTYAALPDYSYNYYDWVSTIKWNASGLTGYQVGDNGKEVIYTHTVKQPKYLSQIHHTNNFGKVVFQWVLGRKDIGSAYLGSIALIDQTSNREIERYILKQNYSDSKYAQKDFYDPLSSSFEFAISGYEDKDRYRLMLQEIEKFSNGKSITFRKFEYASDREYVKNQNGIILYDPFQLPPRKSIATDFWGYYNGYKPNSNDPIEKTAMFKNMQSIVAHGNHKNPHESFIKSNSLRSIIFESGGKTEYSYELSTIVTSTTSPDFPHSVETNYKGSGLRIQKITNYYDLVQKTETIYEYSQPSVGKMLDFSMTTYKNTATISELVIAAGNTSLASSHYQGDVNTVVQNSPMNLVSGSDLYSVGQPRGSCPHETHSCLMEFSFIKSMKDEL